MTESSTIVAVATAPASGGIGVLRISGPAALEACASLAPGVPPSPAPRHAYFTDFVDRQGAVLDQGLFLLFRAPHSLTGEDVVELQAHGSPRLLAMLQAEVLADARVRLASPGEFSRRAFLNGRLDLARAEAVADLVVADSEAAVRAAAAQVQGALSERVRQLRVPLVDLHADLEAALSFPEEAEDAELGAAQRLLAALAGARELLRDAARGRIIRRGAKVVLFGPVNAGKSSLFNQLVGEARALVDEEPGTTRDVLEARLELDGLGLTLVDTAGLREHPGRLESLGIDLARRALRSADLALLVTPPSAREAERDAWLAEAGEVPVVQVTGKSDLLAAPPHPGEPLRVSSVSGEGLLELRALLRQRLAYDGAATAVQLTSDRHADALRRVTQSLERAASALTVSTLEVVAGEVGLAVEGLGEITGESASVDLIDAIFRRFCIGK